MSLTYEEMKEVEETIKEKVIPGVLMKITEKNENKFVKDKKARQAILMCSRITRVSEVYNVKWIPLNDVELRNVFIKQQEVNGDLFPKEITWIWDVVRGREIAFGRHQYYDLWERFKCEII